MPSSTFARAAFVVLLALALNLPRLGGHELESEEARRLLPARSLVEGEGSLAVPRVWGRPYVAKPPGFYLLVAAVGSVESALFPSAGTEHFDVSTRYQAARRELELQEFLDGLPDQDRQDFIKRIETPGKERNVDRRSAALDREHALAELDGLAPRFEPPSLPPVRPISPFATRLAALLGTALSGVMLVTIGRSLRSGAGFVAGCLYVCLPAVLAKSTLGEIETTFAGLCFVGTAFAWRGVERLDHRSAVVGGLVLGLAGLVKGPFAILFSLPALAVWASTRGNRRGAFLRVLVVALLAVVPFVLWYLVLANATGDGDAILDRWREEAGRGGTGGLARFVEDRWRLLSGVVLGWAPASLIVAASWRATAARAWRDLPMIRFGLIVLALGLVVLASWPGVRARYALPLAPWCALLAGTLLVAATRSGEHLPWRAFAERTALTLVQFVGGLVPLVALLLTIAWLVGPDRFLPDDTINIGHVVLAWILAVAGRLVLLRREEFLPGGLLMVALGLAVGLRWIERYAVEGGKVDGHERAAGALWLADAIDRAGDGAGAVALDHWGQFNLLTYTGERFRWTDEPEALATGSLLLTGREEGLERAKSSAWTVVFPPPDGLGREAWRRIEDLRSVVLLRRAER